MIPPQKVQYASLRRHYPHQVIGSKTRCFPLSLHTSSPFFINTVIIPLFRAKHNIVHKKFTIAFRAFPFDNDGKIL